ncbi:MAG TPA: hypothetical protein VG206_05115 [Terriglobia bacterium]|nr:hypothetical protein [Terriglobia bacterium]
MSKTSNPQTGLAEALMEEVRESGEKYGRFLDRLKRLRPGTARYFDLLAELWAESEVLKTKAEHAKEEIDALMESLEDAE